MVILILGGLVDLGGGPKGSGGMEQLGGHGSIFGTDCLILSFDFGNARPTCSPKPSRVSARTVTFGCNRFLASPLSESLATSLSLGLSRSQGQRSEPNSFPGQFSTAAARY